jgi:transcriptional regulator with XRE-family HTH domain
MSNTIPSWSLGDRIRKARRQAEMSQQELADAINVKVGSVSSWEADSATPRHAFEVIAAIAKATDVSVVWLAGLDDGGTMDSHRYPVLAGQAA